MEKELDFEKWESSMGKLILSYARLEYELMRLFKIWIPEKNFGEESYKNMFNTAIGVTKEKLGADHDAITLLIKMKRFSEFRHLVAHNPIHYSNQDSDWFIFDLKNQKNRINLSDLEKLSSDLYLTSLRLCRELRINVK